MEATRYLRGPLLGMRACMEVFESIRRCQSKREGRTQHMRACAHSPKGVLQMPAKVDLMPMGQNIRFSRSSLHEMRR